MTNPVDAVVAKIRTQISATQGDDPGFVGIRRGLGIALQIISEAGAADQVHPDTHGQACGHPNHGGADHRCAPFLLPVPDPRLKAALDLVEHLNANYQLRGVAEQFAFALKHGVLRHELACEDCRCGDHYHCAFNRPGYPRCCCPERLDLNP